ncbi:MAG: energy transducer TonB [Nitrospirae bacterium]|nr:energy transducer TonB [Nitrospirota bacterium]
MKFFRKDSNKFLFKNILTIALMVYFAVVPVTCSASLSKAAAEGEGKVLFKARNRESIKEVLTSYSGSIAFLYRKALRDNPALKGTITVEFTIEPTGKIINARIASSTVNDHEFEDEVLKCIQTWRFPPFPNSGKTVIKYPLDFKPAKD